MLSDLGDLVQQVDGLVHSDVDGLQMIGQNLAHVFCSLGIVLANVLKES